MLHVQHSRVAVFLTCALLYSLGLWQPALCQVPIQTIQQRDSLHRVVVGSKHDTLTIDALNALGRYYANVGSNNDSALFYANAAEQRSAHKQFQRGKADALLVRGEVSYHQGKSSEAVAFYQEALKLYETATNKRGIAEAYNALGAVYNRQSNFGEAEKLHRKALALSQELRDQHGIAKAHHGLGVVYRGTAQYTQSIANYRTALALRERLGDSAGVGATLTSLANVLRHVGQNTESTQARFRALHIQEQLGNKRAMASVLNNLGSELKNDGKFQESLEYLLKAERLAKETQDKNVLANVYTNLGNTSEHLKRFDAALEYHTRSRQMMEQMGDVGGVANTYHNASTVYRKQRRFDEALEAQRKVLEIRKKTGEVNGYIAGLTAVAEIYAEQGKCTDGITTALQALRLADSTNARGRKRSIYSVLAACHDSLGQHREALYAYQRAVAIRDSITTDEYRKQIAELKERYEAEKREQQIALLAKEQSLQQAELKRQSSELDKQRAELLSASVQRQAQAQSIELLNNQRQLQTLALQQREAALTEAQLRADRQSQALRLASQEQALQQAEITRQRTVQFALASVLIAVVAAALWLVRLYRQKERANAKILRQQATLEAQAHEIQLANTALHEANTTLSALNREKTEFLDVVAHDLKNPLIGVRMTAQMLADRLQQFSQTNEGMHGNAVYDVALNDTQLRQEFAEHLRKITATAITMTDVVGTLLEVNRLETLSIGFGTGLGIPLRLTSVDLVAAVQAVADDFYDRAAAKSIAIAVELPTEQPLHCYADARAVYQILDNLVSNAVKFSPFNTTVWLSVHKATVHQPLHAAPTVQMRVRDEGPGISVADRERLFGKYERLSAMPTAGEHSSGLGLAIVKKLSEAMNGRVWYEPPASPATAGATFVVELPFDEVNGEHAADTQRTPDNQINGEHSAKL